MKRVFQDSKQFVDMATKRSPKLVSNFLFHCPHHHNHTLNSSSIAVYNKLFFRLKKVLTNCQSTSMLPTLRSGWKRTFSKLDTKSIRLFQAIGNQILPLSNKSKMSECKRLPSAFTIVGSNWYDFTTAVDLTQRQYQVICLYIVLLSCQEVDSMNFTIGTLIGFYKVIFSLFLSLYSKMLLKLINIFIPFALQVFLFLKWTKLLKICLPIC